jgi:putative transcriptional regulator
MDKTIFESLKRGLKQAEDYKSGNLQLHSYNAKIKIPDVKSIRQKTGLTQEEFGRLFGWCKDTVASWEQKRRAPEQCSRYAKNYCP